MAKTERITVKARIDFPNIWTPKKIMNQGTPVYSATIIIPKDRKAVCDKIGEICNHLMETDSRLNNKDFVRFPLIDGDGMNTEGKLYPEHYHGCFILRAKSNYQPHVFEYDNSSELYRELDDDDERVFAGMEALVDISFFAYAVGGNRGIGVGLGDMCITGEGEPFYNNNPSEKFGAYL